MHEFTIDSWAEKEGTWEYAVTVDPEGTYIYGILRVKNSDPEQPAPIRQQLMDVVELPDGTRQTVCTLRAWKPFAGALEVVQGPPVPEDFAPVKVESVNSGGE